jgi:hypothetical protein
MRKLVISAVALLFMAAVPGLAYGDALEDPPDAPPLFTDNEPLTIELVAPIADLLQMTDRDDREWLDAEMTYTDGSGVSQTLPLRVSTRGRFRLRECQFPPVRLRFRGREARETLFEGQDRIKVVTHCQDRRDEFEQFLLREYLIYRMYNLLTPKSYQVRLARVTYVDDQDRREPITRYAFMIESDEAMAARNGWELMDQFPLVPPDDQDPELLNLVEVFQFMVGNADWSAFQAPPGEQRCCHNVRIIGDFIPPVYPVPYDFDWTGFVNAPYARPDPSLRIRSVRQRVYRGVCGTNEHLPATLQRFQDQRDAMYALIDELEGLNERSRTETREYLDEFYELIDNPRQVNRRLERECRRA